MPQQPDRLTSDGPSTNEGVDGAPISPSPSSIPSAGHRYAVVVRGDLNRLEPDECVPVWLHLAARHVGGPARRGAGNLHPTDLSCPSFVVRADAAHPPAREQADLADSSLTEVLRDLHRQLGRELLLLGGGVSGEQALRQAAGLDGLASALVWALPPQKTGAPDAGDVGSGSRLGRRSVILTDAADPGLAGAIGARARSLGYVHRGRGLHTTSTGHCLLVMHFGAAGHEPTPRILNTAVATLSDPACPGRAVFDALQSAGLVDAATAFALPRDLRREAATLLGHVEVEADPVVEGQQRVRIVGIERMVGGLHFDFRILGSDGETGGSGPVVSALPEAMLPSTPEGMLEVGFTDGFGNRLQTIRHRWPVHEAASSHSPPTVFVYGSCVTRDAFALEQAPPLADYVARSPLGSAFSVATPPEGLIRLEDNPSAFQRRMVSADFDKGLKHLLSSTPFDLLVIDFIDERLAMMRTRFGYVTYSNEARQCGLKPSGTDLVTPGSPEHIRAFTEGLDALLEVVPRHLVLVNKVYWSESTTAGVALPEVESIRRSNAILDVMYTLAAERALTFLPYPDRAFLADPQHKWGLSPFHYAAPLYAHTLGGIDATFDRINR